MGIPLETFSLYQLGNGKYLLTKVRRPGFSNADQAQENYAGVIETEKQKLLLKLYLAERQTDLKFKLGEFQGLPTGDLLYEKHGQPGLTHVWYAKTTFGEPWIFISLADSESAFWEIFDEPDFADNGWQPAHILRPAISCHLTDFITEHDFDLSEIPDAYTEDLHNGSTNSPSA